MEGELLKTYAHHVPSAAGQAHIAALRTAFSQLQQTVNDLCPSSRERSCASTKLEEAAMWAVKSIVINDDDAVVQPAGA